MFSGILPLIPGFNNGFRIFRNGQVQSVHAFYIIRTTFKVIMVKPIRLLVLVDYTVEVVGVAADY
jgi:hypothetical protein